MEHSSGGREMTGQLKPCPFCGLIEAHLWKDDQGCCGFVRCRCGAQGADVIVDKLSKKKDNWHKEAIQKWNTRVEEEK